MEAYQTRRVLDRLYGYEVSPVLWKKVMPQLSAGRVQSVALRLVCDRELEIEKFVAREYWSLIAKLATPDLEKILAATLTGMTVEEFKTEATKWLENARHPRWDRRYTDLVYQPMLEVLRLLVHDANREG